MFTIFWFRRDLRLDDNAGLYHALKNNEKVLPIFIFDKAILDELSEKKDRRVEFIHLSLEKLHQELRKIGSLLWTHYGYPLEIWKQIVEQIPVKAVYTNHDYEPYARQRDEEVRKFLNTQGIAFYTFKDQTIFEKDEILSSEKKPYTVFSPYARKWRAILNDFYLKSYPTEKYFSNFAQNSEKSLQALPQNITPLEKMGFQAVGLPFPSAQIKEEIIRKYAENRNFPAIESTSRLSVHLRFGTVSIRKVAQKAIQLSEAWLNELIWRDFYMMILWHFPHVATRAFKPEFDNIPWRNNEQEFEAWCQGRTGYPIVDAGMRELNATGFMHNRVRMITASFLTKHLLIDWRWGEAYFAKKLLDFDLSANNGGWQWASSSGCDAAPYFRIFNPTTQTQNFDKNLEYVKKWVPELNTLDYPKPIVEHTFARNRCLEIYKKALQASK
ncbi:MAG: DNA photolyase family protein [Microscillaceae bacterium]|nr:DNA photolyase family protein [Microscillaceae bacterium]MDW8459641.1 deoxyribodipyrimidine photo-lyase [Cytophagales bacterium]